MTKLGDTFLDAVGFAARAHEGQKRKGGGAPYLSHPMQVAGLALEHGADEEQAAAALLHDVLEDTEVTYEELREAFGRRVADIVRACSDTEHPERKAPWKQRKDRYLDDLRRAPAEVALVAACDKLHNARSIVTDLRARGAAALERFTGGPMGTLWYYREIAAIFDDQDIPEPLRQELLWTLERLEELIRALD